MPPRRDALRCRTGRADGRLNRVIGEVDSALRALIEREAIGRGDVEAVSYTHLTLPTTPYV